MEHRSNISPIFLHELTQFDPIQNLYLVTVHFDNWIALELWLTWEELSLDSVATFGRFNGSDYLIRRTSSRSETLLERTETEFRILRENIRGVVEADHTLKTPDFFYTLMKPKGLQLNEFINYWAKDYDLLKRILLRVLWIIHQLHKSKIAYRSNFQDNIFIDYGPDKDQLSVELVNFWESDICDPLTFKDRKDDFANFGNLVLFIFSKKNVSEWTNNSEWSDGLKPYYDHHSVTDLLMSLNGRGLVNYNDIATHPSLWSNAKTIQFFNRLYILTSFKNGPMTLDKDDIFKESWNTSLKEALSKGVLEQQKKKLLKHRKLTSKSINIETIEGLVACIRHNCDIHYFDMTKLMQGLIDLPPEGIRLFISCFPQLLMHLFNFVKPKFRKANNKKAIHKALKEFYVSVSVDNYGNTRRSQY